MATIFNLFQDILYCKPTYIRGYFISRFFCDKLVSGDFRNRAFCILRELHKISGSRREIFATVRLS
jgi:hypothetical protein